MSIELSMVPVADGWTQGAWRKSFDVLNTRPADLSDRDVELLSAWPGCSKRESDEARADATQRRDAALTRIKAQTQTTAAPPLPAQPELKDRTANPDVDLLMDAVHDYIAAADDEDFHAAADALEPYLKHKDVFVIPMLLWMRASNARNQQRNQKIAELEAKVAQLERRPATKWCGVWEDGRAYGEASLITDRGSMWIATRDTADDLARQIPAGS